MNCNEAVAALVASLESGVPMTAEQREHIRTCERCRELLDSAKQFQTLLGGNGIQPPPVDATTVAAEAEVRRVSRRRLLAVGFAIIVIAWAALWQFMVSVGDVPRDGAFFLSAFWIGVAFLASLPILLLVWLARAVRKSPDRIYKRLGPGKVLFGVCLGLAERFHQNVSMVRVAFVVALFFNGLGFWVYLVLALAMPVHPDDRQYLLRFRLRRWWARRNGHAEHHAG